MQIANLYMPFINAVKVGVIWLTDLINWCWDPFQEYVDVPLTNDLGSLEALFTADLEARFMQPSGEFFYEIPRPADAGDTALFQGLCTAMKIMKGDNVDTQIAFINTLFVNGTLIRGYRNDGTPNDTTSNDSATGMLFFFYAALRWGSADVRNKSGALLRTWANNLRAHNWALVDLQGNPTQYGKLEDGVMTDPLRITLLLALLSVVRIYDQSFAQDYADLYEKYHSILAYPKVKLLWWDTSYDTHRAAIHLHVLATLMNDPLYKKGLQRIWRITKKENNAWVYTLCHDFLDDRDDALVWRILGTFDFQRRQLGTVESLNPGVPTVNWPPKWVPSWLGNSIERCKYALPFSQRGSQDFFWQRCMFSKDEWIAKNWPEPYHSGLDILICGWLASRLGIKS